MQVNQISDHVTHAVIGNKVAREAQISSSAEFFNVLSNTLYSDKLLAVIREVLCNAWDIHIQQGIIDISVQVTLTDNKLTIRDFGTGIHDDHIVDVYLTYGNSTKKLDGTQTGGFGLGSKAPWAYVEHFQVTSYHEKRKTIYAMSKSSGEVGGKPSALPILTVPTEETGLEVSMAVESREDCRRLSAIIRSIAEFGQMNVTLNGDALPTVAFSEAKHGFMFIKAARMNNVSGGTSNRIFIRYGNVIYPLPVNEKISPEMNAATKAADKISGYNRYGQDDRYNLILQAKPDTISVTPSRESLSMTDHTIKHAQIMLKEFLDLFERDLTASVINTTQTTIAHIWQTGRPSDLLISNNEIPGLAKHDSFGNTLRGTTPDTIADIPTASRAYLMRTYPDLKGFKEKDMLMRLKALEESGFGDRGKIQSFRKEYLEYIKSDHRNPYGTRDKRTGRVVSDWFKRVLVTPLMRKLDQVDGLAGEKLLVCGRHTPPVNERQRYRQEQAGAIVEAHKLTPRPLEDYMPFLRNFVVLSFNRIDIEERLSYFPIMRNWLGQSREMFCYIVPRTTGKAEIARAFFESQGMTVVDLTMRQKWEPEDVVTPVPKPVVQKPRKKGIPLLSGIVKDGKLRPNLIVTNEDFPRTETPEFVVKLNPRAESAPNSILPHMHSYQKLCAVQLYGHLGGVVVNDNQFARFRAMGIPSFEDWLIQRISDEIISNPRLQAFYAMHLDALPSDIRVKLNYFSEGMLKIILKENELSSQFGLPHQTTLEDRKIFSVFTDLKQWRVYNMTAPMQLAEKHVNQVRVSPNLVKLATKVADSKLLRLLDSSQVEELFDKMRISSVSDPVRKKQKEGAMDLLLYAIEG